MHCNSCIDNIYIILKINSLKHAKFILIMQEIEKIFSDESKVIRHLMLSKPIRKLKLKKIQPDKFKGIVNQVNSFIS